MKPGVEVVNADRLSAKLAELKRAHRKAWKVEVMRAALNVESGAKSRVARDRGTLAERIKHRIDQDGMGATVGVMGQDDGTLRHQALAIEFGRRPGKRPPLEVIVEWVKRKKLAGTYSIKTQRRTGKLSRRDAQDRSVAYLIARAIGLRGTPPRPYLFPAYEEERPKFLGRLTAILNEASRATARKK